MNFATEKKKPQFEPQNFKLPLITDATQKVYAYDIFSEKTSVAPDIEGKHKRLGETITCVQDIDWGANHMVFIDKKNRMFTMGQNRDGKTGLGKTIFHAKKKN